MTLRIVYIDFKALNNLAILKTLNVLINLKVLKVFIFDVPPLYTTYEYMISNIDINTTLPSSKFIMSEVYFLTPKANILHVISEIKM